MADVRTLPEAETTPEAPHAPTHATIRREDYRPPDWLVPEIELKFTLGVDTTRVQTKLEGRAQSRRLRGRTRSCLTAMSWSRRACG